MRHKNYNNIIKEISEEAKEKMLNSWVLGDLKFLTKEQLMFFFIQFNYFVNKFPQYIGAMIYNSDSPLVRNILAKNLIDELGGDDNIQKNNASEAHCVLYKKFLISFGVNEEIINKSNPLPCTIKFINTCNEIYLNSHILKALSAFGLGNEGIPKWHRIYSYLKSFGNYNENDLKFFSVHIDVDSCHSDDIIKAILLFIENENDLAIVKEGAMEMIDARYNFYNDLYKEMIKIDNESVLEF